MFTLFPKLPPELRNKIWAAASNQEPRTLDIWTDFKRCEVGNSTFYTQWYSTELAKPPLPAVLKTSRESRAEAKKHYKHEFRTHMSLANGVTVIIPARIYINYACDTLVPRGFWNVVSFTDFFRRIKAGGLVHLAVDIEGSFWRENLRRYCTGGCWPLNGVEEVILYDSRGENMWKGSDYVEKFRKKYEGGRRDLMFEELEEKNKSLEDMKKYLQKAFDRIEGKEEQVVEGDEVVAENIRIPRSLDDCEKTQPEELERPNIKSMKLVAKPVGP
jgi:hypothetical protein